MINIGASHMAQWVKDLPTMQETQETGFDSWVGKIPWRRAWQPTPISLPGESHGQRSLVGYSPLESQESDMTEATGHELKHDQYLPNNMTNIL